MTGTLHPFKPSGSSDAANAVSPRDRRLRLFRLCLGLGLVAAIVLAWLFGLTWWTVLIAALVITCPAAAAWIMLRKFDSWPKQSRTDQ